VKGDAAKAISFGDDGVAELVNDVRAGELLIEIPQNLAVTSVSVSDSPNSRRGWASSRASRCGSRSSCTRIAV
jgi:hypothetical protein